MTYSMDLRERVVAAVESGQSIAAVSRRFEVSRPTVRDWRRGRRRGCWSRGFRGRGGR